MNSHPTPAPLLAIDVGNTRIKFGFFRARTPAGSTTLPECCVSLASPDGEPIPWGELKRLAASISDQPPRAVAATVSPLVLAKLLADWDQASGWPSPRVLNSAAELPLSVHLEEPEKVGIDRLLNAVAGNVIRPPDRSLVIVSSGTATTVDYVSRDGEFEGGAILPGFDLSAKSLHDHTAFLPRVSPEDLAVAPEPLGKSTLDAIRSGVFWGQVGAVKELVGRLSDSDSMLLLTGGGGPMLAPYLPPPTLLLPWLCMQGLALVAQRPPADPAGPR